ncbi:hypothetical protein YTPLAS18_24060 [Nitrospira sp.]|nr:hypothetical protein YTPLAS18_24060 [Nitrospira sp.]
MVHLRIFGRFQRVKKRCPSHWILYVLMEKFQRMHMRLGFMTQTEQPLGQGLSFTRLGFRKAL